MYRVIQWATGSVGRTTLRRIIDHPDLELVGLYVYDPAKVGLDAGEIAKRGPTGVRATNDIEEILALDADVVMHTPLISVPYDGQNADVCKLLASGKDVISVNGFFAPEVHGEAYAHPLRQAALAGQATLAGAGLNPGFIGERMAVTATGMIARLDAIRCREVVDASAAPSPKLVFGTMGFGTDPKVQDVTQGQVARMYDALYAETVHFVAGALETSVDRVASNHALTVAPRDIEVAAGLIRRGTVAATTWRWDAVLSNGAKLSHELLWTSSLALHDDPGDAHWIVEIEGRPCVRLRLGVNDLEPGAPPARALMDATAAVAIRAIPEVVAAAPGFYRPRTISPYHARFG